MKTTRVVNKDKYLNYTLDDIDRFAESVDTSGECWNWKGYIDKSGYGIFHVKSGLLLAHRFAYMTIMGSNFDPLLTVDHICRNRKCIKPDHLRLLTHRENVLCGIGPTAEAFRKTHCKDGHELVQINGNRRRCLICYKRTKSNWYQRNRDKFLSECKIRYEEKKKLKKNNQNKNN